MPDTMKLLDNYTRRMVASSIYILPGNLELYRPIQNMKDRFDRGDPKIIAFVALVATYCVIIRSRCLEYAVHTRGLYLDDARLLQKVSL